MSQSDKSQIHMKCLVTGAAGFIGSHLCERLIADGHVVRAVDDLSTGNSQNLLSVWDSPNFDFYATDILAQAFTHYTPQVDWIFHLAAKADIVPSIKNPALYHRVNVEGTLRALEVAQKVKAKKFIYAASSSCYGIPDEYPTDESAACRPEYPYALTKYVGEQYVMHWAKVYGVPAISLRLFNVFGPRARTSGAYGAVFGVFLAQLAHGRPLTIVGDGTQSRDFTYVTDVVDAFVKAAESSSTHEIFNVGTGHPRTVLEVATGLGATRFEYIPKRPGEPDKTWADPRKIKSQFGWRPKVSFEEALEIMRRMIPEFTTAPLWTRATIEEATKDWFKYLGGGQ